MSKRLSEGASKTKKKRLSDVTSTPLRRSLRLSAKPTPTNYPLSASVYSRSTLPRYNEEFYENETLDESGQSVPLDFDQDVVSHDHSYSQAPSSSTHVSRHGYRVPSNDIREATPTFYGLDGDEDELNRLQQTRDYDVFDKEHILITTVVKGPSLCSQFLNKVCSFFNIFGSLFYLLFAKVVLCDVNMYRRSADCCGRRSKGIFQSIAYFTVFFGFVFLTSTIPHIESPPPPPPVIPAPPPPPTPEPIKPIVSNDEGYEQLLKALNELRNDLNEYKLKQDDVVHDLKRIVTDYFENNTDELYSLGSRLESDLNKKLANETHSRKVMIKDESDSILKKFNHDLSEAIKLLEVKLTDLMDKKSNEANNMDSDGVAAIAKDIVNKEVSQMDLSLTKKIDRLNTTLNQLKKKQVADLKQASEEWRVKMNELQEKQKEYSQQILKEMGNLSGEVSGINKEQEREIKKLEEELKTISNKIVKLEEEIADSKNIDVPLPSGVVTADTVSSMITDALYNYSADQVARFDFALESAGGHVISSSDTYDPSKTKPKLFGFALPISLSRSFPAVVIQPSVMPGDCWCFQGFRGFVTVKLATPAIVDAVTVQHLPKELSPVGTISSAMKSFTVKGLNSLTDEGTPLDSLEYLKDGPPIQTFNIENKKTFDFIQFSIDSNHGNPDYTCIYRLRVHGALPLKD